MSEKDIDELESLRERLGSTNSGMWDSKKDDFAPLPPKPTVEQLKDSLEMARADTSEALGFVLSHLSDIDKEIRRLNLHRHETTRTFSGRPE